MRTAPSPHAPTVAVILRESFTAAPSNVRRSGVAALLIWLAMMAAQAVDSWRGSGVPATVEFLSALFGSTGGILLALTGVLSSSVERRALIALPAVGVVSAGFLSAAVALMIVRGLLGSELVFVVAITLMYGVFLWVAANAVMQGARGLYVHAQTEADAASRARMNPHFLFNALNTVAALVRTDPATAERVTENLSDVLRMTLDQSNARTISVADELSYLRAWLAVEHERWKDRLRVTWDVEPGIERMSIPPLLVQPVVENAIRHGLGGRIEGGHVRVTLRRDGSHLLMRVEDDGVGFAAAHVERTGLSALRARLDALYGGRASLTIERLPRGSAVAIRVPL